jgi:glycosyltransferase involved in cell wall biosynthesis
MSRPSVIEQAPPEPDDAGPARTRVLLLIKGLGRGGAEQLLVNAAEYGDGSRFEYHVAYLLPWKDAFVPDLRALGIPVTCLDGARGLGWVRRLKRLLREWEIDLVHVHSPAVAAVVRTALRRRRPVLVTTEHNVWARYHRATYWANALTFPRNDHVFTVSDEVGESIRYPMPLAFLRRPPVETLHHGIDVRRIMATSLPGGAREELGIPRDAPVVGTVANFKPHKGHEYMVKVAELVARERPDVRFVMVGGGPLQEQVRQQVEELGLRGTVVLPGFRDDALRIAGAFDVYAMASLHEGLPLTLLEAMALGCPPVATRVGGVTAVVNDGVSGFIVEPRDPVAQAARILTLLSDPSMRTRFGAAARERAAAFDVRKAARRIEHVYSELVR